MSKAHVDDQTDRQVAGVGSFFEDDIEAVLQRHGEPEGRMQRLDRSDLRLAKALVAALARRATK